MIYTAIIFIGLVTSYWYSQQTITPPVLVAPLPPRSEVCSSEEVEHITIFVHGASHVPLVLLNPIGILTNTINPTGWYTRAQLRSRLDAESHRISLMLDLGLTEVFPEQLPEKLPQNLSDKAAYHIIRAFYSMHVSTTDYATKIRHRFFTFGWSGNMRPEERTKGAQQLYEALLALQAQNTVRNVRTEFSLYAFSHGGQLILELPAIRRRDEQSKEHKLVIDRAIISGTPLYRQNTRNLLLGMFKTFVNIYSPGDYVQTIDRFTTPEGKCFQTIAETMPLPRPQTLDFSIIDVCITIGGKKTIGHKALFELDGLALPNFRSRRSEQYTKSHTILCEFIAKLNPFPLLVVYPAFMPTLLDLKQQHGYVSLLLDLHLSDDAEPIAICTTADTRVIVPLPLYKLQKLQEELIESYNARIIPQSWYTVMHNVGHALASLLPSPSTPLLVTDSAIC